MQGGCNPAASRPRPLRWQCSQGSPLSGCAVPLVCPVFPQPHKCTLLKDRQRCAVPCPCPGSVLVLPGQAQCKLSETPRGNLTGRFSVLLLQKSGNSWQAACVQDSPQSKMSGLTMRLRSGVIRDLERQNQKKENIRLLEEQIALTKQLVEERDKALMEKRSQ
ncbi:PREDICTED: protein PET117 homolog, mitochondrial [Corvus brachyrhynchos]|uniref:protein PET117 homolog, mitochondrial n=1 Tax=Corvus brachyrhynchos TaxID=85066 RepID=UPI00081635C9|nr:PREDICTED: protein PET117 homolog, mitochondrial [Corvus brachyrhynchos]